MADDDHDPCPDLAVFSYAGDGVHRTEARTGDRDTGLADRTADTSRYRDYADQTNDETPSNMPGCGLRTFCPECPTAGRQG